MSKLRHYVLKKRYLATGEGWKLAKEDLVDFTYEEAARQASDAARHLDAAYGDDHFWTVDLQNPQGESYFQLFHGRLS